MSGHPADRCLQMRFNALFGEMARAVLREGSGISFRAGGKSMSPFICNNEIVVIEPIIRKLRVGDVILFEGRDRKLILHRIVKKTEGGYITRGDASGHDDGLLQQSEVLGRAVGVLGGMNLHLRFPLNRLLVFALGLKDRPLLFNLFRIPGRMLLKDRGLGTSLPMQIDMRHDLGDNKS